MLKPEILPKNSCKKSDVSESLDWENQGQNSLLHFGLRQGQACLSGGLRWHGQRSGHGNAVNSLRLRFLLTPFLRSVLRMQLLGSAICKTAGFCVTGGEQHRDSSHQSQPLITGKREPRCLAQLFTRFALWIVYIDRRTEE